MTREYQDLLEELLAAMAEAEGHYRELLGALEREKKALAAANLPEFMVAGEQKGALVERLQELETQRMQQSAELGRALGLPDAEMTLRRLAGGLEGKDAARLIAGGEKLVQTLALIRDLNRVNRRLVSGSLGFVRDSLQMLQHVKRPSSTYHRNGQMTRSSCRGTILAGEI